MPRVLQCADAQLRPQVHLQAYAAVRAGSVDLAPAAALGEVLALKDPGEHLDAVLLRVHEGQRRLPKVRPTRWACPPQLRVISELSCKQDIQSRWHSGCRHLWRIAHRQARYPAKGEALPPPSEQLWDLACEASADPACPIQRWEMSVVLRKRSPTDGHLPQCCQVPELPLLNPKTGCDATELARRKLRAQDTNTAAITPPCILQTLVNPLYHCTE
mmetsp:Transcript_86933/g.241055  ORF Transcript_86933/g.241055 Transcript_86933/m.241055 type:complete len:216 (-) Transcript_86933:566-1213(-)